MIRLEPVVVESRKTIALLVLAAASAQFGRAAESIPQELPKQEGQAALRKAEAMSLAIYKHDHAAAVEIHLFWSLWTGIPLDILTPPNGMIWNISKGHISLVRRGGK